MKLRTGTSCLGALYDPERYLYDKEEVQNVITKSRILKKSEVPENLINVVDETVKKMF